MTESEITDMSETDHVQRMIFTLPVEGKLLDEFDNRLMELEWLAEVFDRYCNLILDYPFWVMSHPTQVQNVRAPEGYQLYTCVVAVLRRPDEDVT